MTGALQYDLTDANERALPHALLAALRRYRGDAESDDGQAEDLLVALAARFHRSLNELAIPHARDGEV